MVSEFWYYRAVETKYDYAVDTDANRWVILSFKCSFLLKNCCVQVFNTFLLRFHGTLTVSNFQVFIHFNLASEKLKKLLPSNKE